MSSPQIDLVSLTQAQRHLRLPEAAGTDPTGDDTDLQRKIDQATDQILDYLARADDDDWTAEIAAWTPTTAPGAVIAAILLLTGELYWLRGDEPDMSNRQPGFLSPTIVALLARYRDPVLG